MEIKTKLIIMLVMMLLPTLAFAQSYPDTCPQEAQGVLNAVGGCEEVDCNQFSAICEKCCTQNSSVSSAKGIISSPLFLGILAFIVVAGSLVIWKVKQK